MTEQGSAANRQESVAESMKIVLRNIAKGYWNAGRSPGTDLTAREYARQALKDLGLWEDTDA